MVLRSWKSEGLIILLILAILIGFFWDVLFGSNVLLTCNPNLWYPWRHYASKADLELRTYRTDSALTYLPRMAYLHDSLRSGKLPLWNPYIFMGFPFWADPQSRVLYPITLLLALLDPYQAMGVDIFAHFFMAILGMYLFLKNVTSDRIASLFGGFAFGFSGFMTTRMGHPTFVATTSWIPWIFFAYGLIERSRRYSILILAVCFAMSYLAGFPQITFFAVGSLLLYAIWMGVEDFLQSRSFNHLKNRSVPVVLAGAIALLLVSPVLIPFLEFFANSRGLGLSFPDMVKGYVSSPWLLARMVFPFAFGNPVEGTSWLTIFNPDLHPYNLLFIVYIGVGGLIAAIGSIAFLRSSREIRFFWFLLFLSIGVGVSPTVLRVFYSLFPMLRLAQIDRICVLANFSLAALSGITLSRLSSTKVERKMLVGITILCGMVLLVVFIVLGFDSGGMYKAIIGRIKSLPPEVWYHPASRRIVQWLATDGWEIAKVTMKMARLWALLVAISTVLLVATMVSKSKPRMILAWILVGLCLFDLLLVARSYYVSHRRKLDLTESIELLKNLTASPAGWRAEALLGESGVFPPNTNQVFGIPSTRGQCTILPEAFAEFVASYGKRRVIGKAGKLIEGYADIGCARFLLAGDLDTSLAMSPLIKLIASSEQHPIRTVTIGGKPMVALTVDINSSIDLDVVLPEAERLDLYLGFDRPAQGTCVVARVEVEKRGGESQSSVWFEKQFQAEDFQSWQNLALDISDLGKGEVHLKICCLGETSDSTRCYWGGFEIVRSDCQVKKADHGYEIMHAGNNGIQGILAIEVKGSGLLPLELLIPERIVRFVDFKGRPDFQSILVEIPSPVDRVVLRSTEQFEIGSARLVHVEGSLPADFCLIHISDMMIIENMAALPRGLVLSKGYVEVDGWRKQAFFLGGSISEALCGVSRVEDYTATRVSIDVEADQPGYLVFQDIHYPGWTAFVDGKPACIYKIYGLRCIAIDKGRHQVVMYFRPKSLIVGSVFFLIGIGICILRVMREKRRHGIDRNV